MQMPSPSPWRGDAAVMAQPAVLAPSDVRTWHDLHAQAGALAAALPPGAAVCHLCSGMGAFLVGLLAAWRRACTVVLPPSGGVADIAALLRAVEVAALLTDGDGRAQGLGDTSLPTLRVTTPRGRPGPSGAPINMPAAGALQLRLYTSGSTGVPQAQLKSLAQLVRGAVVLHRRLLDAVGGGAEALRHIVSSVPPQHMFGLEAAVMLALVHGLPVAERRPLLPADVAQAFARPEGGGLWVATPVHLRAIVRASVQLPGCAAVLVSTMPLAPALAAEAERLLGVPVLEIYGSTETGALALRRTANETDWTPLDGVSLQPDDAGCLASGEHFTSPCRLTDLVQTTASGSFQWLGRAADLVKIGGRRASLSGLNQLIDGLPGLDEGVLHWPAAEAGDAEGTPRRLVLIHAGRPLDVAAALTWLRARLDPAFVPRSFVHVAALPRTDAGKLRRQDLDAIVAHWRATAGSRGA